jgi:hypothetical protein
MRPPAIVLTLLLVFFSATGALFAQASPPIGEDLSYDLNADPQMRPAPAAWKPFTLSYGGWITPVIIDERKGSETALTTSITTMRLWMQSTLWKNSFIYVRGKDVYLTGLMEKNRTKPESENTIDLDLAFIQMATPGGALRFSAGRKYFILGTGLAFNGRGDGAELNIFSRFVDVKAFGVYTGLLAKDQNPYGLSGKDFSDGAKRVFAGGTIERGIVNQTLYLLAMIQMDRQEEEAGVESTYDSQYYGAGLKGLIVDGMDYYAEFIYQMGENNLETPKKDIKAMAGMFGLNYYFDAALNPALLFQYAYGSGDDDTADDEDTTFTYFGTYVGGFALRPQLRNIHIARLGFSFVPFYSSEKAWLKRMNVIARYSYYMKDKVTPPASVGEGPLPERFLGHGADLSLRWAIFSDLSFFVNYGLFLPGDAYSSSEGTRNFVMGGFNLVF